MRYRTFAISFVFFCLGFAAWTQPYTISTIAGTDRLLDGHAANTVPLRGPVAVAVDSSGNLYIADSLDNRIRKVDTSGNISTFAGTGSPGYNGDRIKAVDAQVNFPDSVALDNNGNLYFADAGNATIRIISPDGIINTVAGNGTRGLLGDNGPALQAQIDPVAVAVDTQGNLYISTNDNHIRKVDAKGIITTIAGTGVSAYSGDNGPANLAAISLVPAMVADAKGNLYLADLYNGYVRMIDGQGIIHPIAGTGQFGGFNSFSDSIPALEALMLPSGLALDRTGTSLYIADQDLNHTVVDRLDLTSGLIHIFAGNGNPGFLGDGGMPLNAEFNSPSAVAVDSASNVYVADYLNQRVRKIVRNTVSTVAGTSIGDGGSATSAFLNFPQGLAVDAANNLVIADTGNSEARRVVLGGAVNSFGKLLAAPITAAVDSSGNFFVSDNEPVLLKIAKTGSTSIVAGKSGQPGYSGDNGAATSATITNPTGVAVDAAGDVYFTDDTNNRIRKVAGATGIITTIAGNGNLQYSGDRGPALSAGMDPFDIAVDAQGSLYVADNRNHRVRKIGLDGNITTVAGNGIAGYTGDGGPATSAELAFPTGVAVDSAGYLYIGDYNNSVVRRVTPNGLITTIAGTPQVYTPAAGDGGPAVGAQLDPFRVALDAAGNVYVSDSLNDRVRKLTPLAVTAASLKAVSGDKQSATVGLPLGDPLVVKVSDASGAGVPGVVVNFTANPPGTATLSATQLITLNDGTASVNVTLGATAGSFTVTASAAGLANATFSGTANPAVSPTAPVISAVGIVSAGLSAPPVTTVSSNGIATIFGDKFAPAGTARQVGQQDLVDGKIPTTLAGACAVFGTQLAPILNVYPGQLNVQVPQLPPGDVEVQVITKCGTADAETSNSEAVTIAAASPEFFYFTHTASGHNAIAAINAKTSVSIGSQGLVPGVPFIPAMRGDILTLFGTGFGMTDPSFFPGVLPGGAAQVTASTSITFGGVPLAASDILYVGVTSNAGLYQVNLRVPDGVPDGDQPLVLTVGGVQSPAGAYLTVKGAVTAAARH